MKIKLSKYKAFKGVLGNAHPKGRTQWLLRAGIVQTPIGTKPKRKIVR